MKSVHRFFISFLAKYSYATTISIIFLFSVVLRRNNEVMKNIYLVVMTSSVKYNLEIREDDFKLRKEIIMMNLKLRFQ